MQPQCKDGGKFASDVASSRKDTLVWLRLRCHMCRGLRLAAGLQQQRAASTAHSRLMFRYHRRLASRPVAPTECAAGPCEVFRLWCSASTPKWNVRICSSVYVHASQKSMLPNHACAPPKNQRCLSLISMRSSSLLAHTSPDTRCLCVCHGSATFVGPMPLP